MFLQHYFNFNFCCLTIGADNIVGDATNDTINGLLTDGAANQATFQTWDSIDGGAGTNTLNVQTNGSSTIAATLANIQNMSVQQGVAGTPTLNLNGLTSLTNLNLEGLGNPAAGATGFTVNNLGSLPAIGLTATAANSTININASALTGASELTVTVDGVNRPAAGNTALTISRTGTGSLETLNINSTGATSNLGTVALGTATAAIGTTAININAQSNLTIEAITDIGATARTIDASDSTANVTISNAASSGLTAGAGLLGTTGLLTNSTVTGGAGVDVYAITGGTVNNITLGAGNDRVNAISLTNTDTITGGDGTDAIRTTSALAVAYGAVATDTITGVETLQISDQLAGALVTSNLSNEIVQVDLLAGSGTQTITMGAGTATINVGRSDTTAGFDDVIVAPAKVSPGISGDLRGNLTVAATGTATTDVLNLNNVLFNQTTGLGADLSGGGARNLTINGYETVNFNTGLAGAATGMGTITLNGDSGANTSLVVTGNQTLNTGIISATTIDASALVGSTSAAVGVQGLVMGAPANLGLTSITGSAYADTLVGDTSSSIAGGAGSDDITGGANADTLLGQDGNDSIAGAGGNDSIDGGAGNDIVTEVAANITVSDTIKGGEGTDRLVINNFGAALSATNLSGISQFEVLQVAQTNGTGIVSQSMSDFANNTGFTEIRATSGTTAGDRLGFTNVSADTNVLGLVGTAGSILFDRLVDTSTDSLTVNSRSAAGAAITLTGLTADDEETITFNTLLTNADGTTNNIVTNVGALAAADLKTLKVTGGGAFTATLGSSAALATIDLTGSSGNINIDANSSLANMTVTNGTGAMTITAGGGNDSITGADLDDSLSGGVGADTLVGNGGNDVLVGGRGADSIVGGSGDNTYSAVGTDGQLDGGATASVGQVINLGASSLTETAIFRATGGLTISSALAGIASNTAAYLGAAGTISTNLDSLSQIQSVIGSAGTDYIVGSSGINSIDGGLGADTIVGGAAADSLTGAGGADTFVYNAAVGTSSDSNVTTQDTISDLTVGTDFVRLVLTNTNNFEVATDVFGPTALYQADTNGNGVLTDVSDVVVTATGWGANDGNARALTVLNATGTAGNDTISGGANADTISGGDGADLITGAAGADSLTGGAGADTFVIGSTADTRAAGFALTDTTGTNLDIITDFVGNGAAAGDTVQLSTAANVFGAALQFTGATLAAVTTVTLNNQADFAFNNAAFNIASSASTARIVDVTLTGTGLAANGVTRVLVLVDETGANTITTSDTIINMTGITGALNAQDFTFA